MWVDCDVLQADGGTRTAAITGASLAVAVACRKLVEEKKIAAPPMTKLVAAVSAGVLDGAPIVDLNYEEDKAVTVDFNLVATEDGEFVELQGSGEEATFSQDRTDCKCSCSGRKGVGTIDRRRSAPVAGTLDGSLIRPKLGHEDALSSPESLDRMEVILPICLLEKGYEVHGIIRRASTFNTSRIDHLYADPHINGVRMFLHYGDLTDSVNLVKLLYELKPDEIYHLGRAEPCARELRHSGIHFRRHRRRHDPNSGSDP